MTELEELKNTIIKKYKDKFVFFEMDGMSPDDIKGCSVTWAGDNYIEFLNMAERVGSKIIYYSEAFPDTLEKYAKHIEDIAEIDLGFLCEGILHTMPIYASWYTPTEDIIENEVNAEKLPKEFEEKPAEEIAREMIEFAYREFPDSLTDFYHVADAFWQSKGLQPFNSDAKTRLKMDKIKQIAEKQIMTSVISKEKEKLPKIVEECVKWAKENGFNKLTRGNLQAFLLEHGLDLSYPTQDALYIKVNFELKKK
ncbi:MAG: hypothetical protein KGJ87_09160 [Planctomycetota bacterium]|nr:hypothetical protein [Planctomycetota bacterium]